LYWWLTADRGRTLEHAIFSTIPEIKDSVQLK